MTRKQRQVQVVKVPLDRAPLDQPQVFPRMPRLYLELLENKTKIHQDLINREHIPSERSATLPGPTIDRGKQDNGTTDPSPPPGSKNFDDRLDMLLSDDDSEDGSLDSSNSEGSIPSTLSALSIQEEKNHSPSRSDDDVSDASSDLSVRLKELLNDDSDSNSDWSYEKRSSSRSRNKSDKYSRPRDQHGHSAPAPPPRAAAPTLAELEAQGGYVPRKELRDLNQSSRNEQHDEDAKREILFKFDLLRKSYPASSIPEYTIHTDLDQMEKSYSDCVRRLSLDSSVESYKTYLVYGFMGCEFVLGNFLGFDMQGFTQQQIISMHSYEKLLIELGEKSYVPAGSKWPVELRLLFMIIMNAAFFVISKMMMKKTGANLMGMINSMNSAAPPQSSSAARKRRMRGPNVDLGDIPETS